MARKRAGEQEASSRPRRARWLRPVLLGAMFLVPAVAAALFLSWRSGEERQLARARAQLERGEWESASASLRGLAARPFLGGEARRGAAELLFRLGEDQTAHRLMAGQSFDPRDRGDQRLREVTIRAQRAANLLHQADREPDAAAQVRLLRQARDELPEAPGLLRRLAEAALAAYVRTNSRDHQSLLETSYAELAMHAPGQARALKESIRAAIEAAPPPPGPTRGSRGSVDASR